MALQTLGRPASPSDNSFPTPLPTAGSTQAPSIISSRMTDAASEEGDETRVTGATSSKRPATAKSTGAFSNDPNRPPSSMSSQNRSWTQSHHSRRGLPSPRHFGGWRSNGPFGGPGVAMSNTSRPQSATSSRTSRTHVPSLASHAFFRPMSSQRLQAQRGARVAQVGQSIAGADGSSDIASITNRQSVGSNGTSAQDYQIYQENEIPISSRVSEFTEREEPQDSNPISTGRDGISDIPEEAVNVPKDQRSNVQTSFLDFGKHSRQANGTHPIMQRSSKPFRGNLFSPAKRLEKARNDTSGHERLSSSTSSPQSSNTKMPAEVLWHSGRNYEYFAGNTIFCLGGRLQNTRDRPINIVSGILVVLPSILFFASS